MRRYCVWDGGKMFASVLAESAWDAVRRACRITDGHDARRCIAEPATPR